MTREAASPDSEGAVSGTLFVEEPRFAIVPEWVIDAAVSDGAFHLYSLLARARAELTAEGMPVIRSTVARRACAILDLHQLQ